MKKLLLLLAIFATCTLSAQFNQSAPWMEGFDLSNRSVKVKFQDIVDAAEAYFETIDKDAKGSGYKPFKRWEAYWINYVDADGYLPSAEEIWNGAKEAQFLSATRNTQVDESNWISLGPTDFTNRPTSTANIGRLNVIVKDPNNANIYYAGAPAGGIWKSEDAGLSWTPLSDELPQIGVSGIAIDYNDSNTIYIATGDDDANDSFSVGVFKSTDGGLTWNETGLNPGNSPSDMNDIYIDPNDSNDLWVATNNGVYRTTNGGTTWSNTLAGINIKDIKIKPGDTDVIYAASQTTFYRSSNGGITFNIENDGTPTGSGRLVIDVTPANPEVVYILAAYPSSSNYAFQGIYKSTNSGNSFTQKANTVNIMESSQAWYDLALAVSDTNEDEIYTGCLNIWKSTNGGDNFSKMNSWFQHNAAFTHADIHFLRFFDNELYAGTDGGFYKSNDGAITFTDLTEGMEITQFYRMDVSPTNSNKIAGGTQDNGGFGYFNQWNNYHGGDGMEGVIDPNNDNLYYGFMQFGQNLFVSNDSGQSGSAAYGGPENGNWITPLNINSESEIYAGYSRVYQFTGSGFTPISGSFGTDIDAMEIDPNNPDNMYVAINNSLRKSTDRGQNFVFMENFPSFITSIEVNNNDGDVIYVTTSGFGGGVWVSTNGGADFTEITGSLPVVTKNIIKHRPDDPLNQLYLGTNVGVYLYDDNTGDWEAFDNNLPNTSVRDLELNLVDENITVGTYGRGMWRSPLQSTQLAQNDVRLVGVNDPSSNAFSCSDVTPQIEVKNNGQDPISTIDVVWSVDGGTNNNFQWTGSLASQATTTIDLPTLSLPRGEHNLDVSVNITNDAFPSNNDSGVTFYTNDDGVAQLVNTFEDPSDELITFNDGGSTPLWERGVPTGAVLNTANSGTQVYATNLDGNHPDLTKAYLLSQCYDLSVITNPILKFHMAFEIEFDWDLVYVEYTLDEGENWSLLGSASDPNWYNSSRFAGDGVANNCFNCVGGQWTGTNTTLNQYTYDLAAFTNEPSIIFRMVFHSDQSVNEEGVIVDDFFVDGTLSTEEFVLDDIKIYPNPSRDIFNIKLNNVSEFSYSVMDLTGKMILDNIEVNGREHALDMSGFAGGMYFLNLEANGRTLTKKLMLQ